MTVVVVRDQSVNWKSTNNKRGLWESCKGSRPLNPPVLIPHEGTDTSICQYHPSCSSHRTGSFFIKCISSETQTNEGKGEKRKTEEIENF